MDTKLTCDSLLSSLADTKGAIPSSADMTMAVRCVDDILLSSKEDYILHQAQLVKKLVVKCESYQKADKKRQYRFEAYEAAYRLVEMIKRKEDWA